MKGDYYSKKQKAIEVMKKIVKNAGKKGIDIEVLVMYLQESVIFLSNKFFIDEIERRNGGELILDKSIVKWNFKQNEAEAEAVLNQVPVK